MFTQIPSLSICLSVRLCHPTSCKTVSFMAVVTTERTTIRYCVVPLRLVVAHSKVHVCVRRLVCLCQRPVAGLQQLVQFTAAAVPAVAVSSAVVHHHHLCHLSCRRRVAPVIRQLVAASAATARRLLVRRRVLVLAGSVSSRLRQDRKQALTAVSYTHLTLPTILRV